MVSLPQLPIDSVLPELLTQLSGHANVVLVAPPGAGKTTRVPLALLDAAWRDGGKIIVLEPRRLAARAAASRMAQMLGEAVGKRVGYRVRFDTKVSNETIIEVVTEGVFTRMLSQDPMLEGIAAVLFDEFHERSLDGDLGLALCLDLQSSLREDLRLLPMSATLDGASVANLMQAPVVESEGRAFPVTIEYRERMPRDRLDQVMATTVVEELKRDESGSILAFLPGQGEIERTFDILPSRLPKAVELHRLYGALSTAAQDAAISPSQKGTRKVVLASAIAETSLTIEGITTVIDSGLSRQPVFEPSTGLTRLETVRASLASVTQRAGRAGRLGPGRAVRLWREEQTKALSKHTPPEIKNADLAALLLDLTDWGIVDPSKLKWLDEPPIAALNEARELLRKFGALNEKDLLTPHGKAMRSLSLPPRLAHMVVCASEYGRGSAQRAALLALLVQERGVGGSDLDISERCSRLEQGAKLDGRAKSIVKMAQGIAKQCPPASANEETLSHGVLLALGFLDRVAKSRGNSLDDQTRFKLANGRGAQMHAHFALAREEFIVVIDMSGRAGAARILSAASISKNDLLEYFAHEIEDKTEGSFDKSNGKLSATRISKFGALSLSKPQPVAIDPQVAEKVLLSAIRDNGLDFLPWRNADRQLRGRLQLLHKHLGDPWPAVSDEALLVSLETWLAPFLNGATDLSALGKGAISDGLLMLAGHPSKQEMDRLLPTHFSAPSGSSIPIIYHQEHASISVRPQELFGLNEHPTVLNGQLALDIELLSPAGRAIQITRNLPAFWHGTWADVRSDMRGRYPKHPWPEDASSAEPTRRVKPRKK